MTAQAHRPTCRHHPAARVRDKRNWRRRIRGIIAVWLCIGVAVSLFLQSCLRNRNSETPKPDRKLLESSECTSQPRWIEEGGVVLYVWGLCYMFFGMTIICDDFFIGSLETISEKLNLSADVAGATFMAAGSSAPELFTSFAALLNDRVSNEIEVGTIVGSAVFNILVVIGVSAIFSGRKLRLDYRPLVRDGLFYLVAIAGVMGACYDGKIYWWEGLIFVMLYGVYILALKFNKELMGMFPPPTPSMIERFNANSVDLESLPYEPLETFTSDEEICYQKEVNDNMAPLLPLTSGQTLDGELKNPEQDVQDGAGNANSLLERDQTKDDDENPFSLPEGKVEKLYWMLMLPWKVSFHYTVPDCSKENLKQWYLLTFVSSILWIGVISWFMVEWAADIGCVLGIRSEIMGETVIALGISIPDAMSSIIVARDGQGDMAVANAIGSNVFDIWLGLGIPWLVVIPFVGATADYGKYIEADNGRLFMSTVVLFGVLIFYTVCVIGSGWRIDKRHGSVFIILYLAYTLYDIIVRWALESRPEKE